MADLASRKGNIGNDLVFRQNNLGSRCAAPVIAKRPLAQPVVKRLLATCKIRQIMSLGKQDRR
jgi:hypothetical protein